jgi:hypothetical protein
MLQKRPFRATGHIDAAGVANAATVQEYRAKWRRVNETKVTGNGYYQGESYQLVKT